MTSVGGLTGDIFGIVSPYQIAFLLMLVSTIYSTVFLPYTPPTVTINATTEKTHRSIGDFAGPLKMFLPEVYVKSNGASSKYFGRLFLGLGVFMGVVCAIFAHLTDIYPAGNRLHSSADSDVCYECIRLSPDRGMGYYTKSQLTNTQNGYLMATNSLIRGGFLTFIFPVIISRGRAWFATSSAKNETIMDLPVNEEDFQAIPPLQSEQEPVVIKNRISQNDGSAFDLFFLRWSLVADAVLTGSAGLSKQGWHIYLGVLSGGKDQQDLILHSRILDSTGFRFGRSGERYYDGHVFSRAED